MTQTKVTLIDDEINILETLKDLLELDNYLVQLCINPLDAINLIKTWKPNIIICDIMMPKIDGFELVEKIRNDKEIAHIPVIFLTAKNITENFRKSMTMGVDDFINKPFVFDEIKVAIKSRLNRFNEIKENPYFDLREENKKYKDNNITSPLYGILGSLQLFTNINAKTKNEDETNFFPAIKKTEYRLSRTFQNIILLKQRVKEKEKEIRNYKTSIEKSINDTIFEICNLYDLPESRFIIDIQKKNININPIDLSYILFEILTNAIKFTELDTTIEIKSEDLKNSSQIIIKDYGKGFSTNEIKNIAPFTQFQRATKDDTGLGLGITLCKKLVEKMEGEFRINSKKNNFTKVYIKMPK